MEITTLVFSGKDREMEEQRARKGGAKLSEKGVKVLVIQILCGWCAQESLDHHRRRFGRQTQDRGTIKREIRRHPLQGSFRPNRLRKKVDWSGSKEEGGAGGRGRERGTQCSHWMSLPRGGNGVEEEETKERGSADRPAGRRGRQGHRARKK